MCNRKMPFAMMLLAMVIMAPAGADLQCTNELTAATATTAHLVDNDDGTVSDPKTGLMWKKCPEGQTWNTDTKQCNGTVATYTWQQVLQRTDQVDAGSEGENLGHDDWRLPSAKELASIVELRCWNPAINEAVFPAVSGRFWSSSPAVSTDGDRAWAVDFDNGNVDRNDRGSAYGMRLVRSEE